MERRRLLASLGAGVGVVGAIAVGGNLADAVAGGSRFADEPCPDVGDAPETICYHTLTQSQTLDTYLDPEQEVLAPGESGTFVLRTTAPGGVSYGPDFSVVYERAQDGWTYAVDGSKLWFRPVGADSGPFRDVRFHLHQEPGGDPNDYEPHAETVDTLDPGEYCYAVLGVETGDGAADFVARFDVRE